MSTTPLHRDETDLAPYLEPTWFVDSDSPAVIEFAREAIGDATEEIDCAVKLFYAVRDSIRYSPYGIKWDRESFRASHVLAVGRGWCVTKSCLLAAAARSVGLPCRLGFADVRNHLATEKLLKTMGTDVFYYHGYNEFYLEGRWVKATVAFNKSLCDKAGLLPLEFDGRSDSLYHPFDREGRRYMEYLHHYGTTADVPYDAILTKFAEVYANMVDRAGAAQTLDGDFEAEIAAESASREGED